MTFSNLFSQKSSHALAYTEHELTIHENIPIKYYKMGDGRHTLLLIHGLGSNKKSWIKLIPELEDNYTIYAIDLPKYLDSDNDEIISMHHYSQCLEQFIDKLDLKEVHLIGHSMGGQLAMYFDIHSNVNLKSLTLIAPAGIETFSETDQNWFDTYVTKPFFLGQTEAALKYSFDINFFSSKIPDDALFMLEERKAIKLDSIKFDRYINYTLAAIKAMLNEPVANSLNQIATPTLICYADNDQLIPNKILHPQLTLDDLKNTSSQIPNVNLITAPNSGHFIQWDASGFLAQEIKKFINNL